jgi:hypothetical protein
MATNPTRKLFGENSMSLFSQLELMDNAKPLESLVEEEPTSVSK